MKQSTSNSKVKWNVLVFPAGMENGIEIFYSLRHCKEVKLFAASSSGINHTAYLYRESFVVRDVRESGWIDDLNNVITSQQIDLIFPANSFVIDQLSSQRHLIKAPILIPEDSVVRLTRSKRSTIEALSDHLPTPQCFSSIDDIREFPVFAKPDKGYGSQGALLIKTKSELSQVDFEKNVVQEYLPGREYTIDCLSDHNGNLLFSGGRERLRIRMGTSMHAEMVDPDLDKYFAKIANAILHQIKITGAWFFQMKEDRDGKLKLLEIDTRIAGTMCYNRNRGVNFPLMAIYIFFKRPVNVLCNQLPIKLDRSLKNRYIQNVEFQSVYIDLDDTIIIKDKINIEAINFLYQCINNKKKIILISKSLEKNPNAYLVQFKLHQIFDEIIWLNENQNKADFITSEKPIFIDDSFSQRKEVSDRLGIPVFDPSMLEGLIDERY